MVISVDLWSAVKDTIKFLKRRNAEKIPLKIFIKKIEKRQRMKLSEKCKVEILYTLQKEGTIKHILESRDGKMYVILGDLF